MKIDQIWWFLNSEPLKAHQCSECMYLYLTTKIWYTKATQTKSAICQKSNSERHFARTSQWLIQSDWCQEGAAVLKEAEHVPTVFYATT